MFRIRSFLRWSWLLSAALLAPLDLPAGGRQSIIPSINKGDIFDPSFAGENCILHKQPVINYSSRIRALPFGTPIHVLRTWKTVDGDNWFYIKVASSNFLENGHLVKKGWISV